MIREAAARRLATSLFKGILADDQTLLIDLAATVIMNAVLADEAAQEVEGGDE